jgi:hypothetical protein
MRLRIRRLLTLFNFVRVSLYLWRAVLRSRSQRRKSFLDFLRL